MIFYFAYETFVLYAQEKNYEGDFYNETREKENIKKSI